jgi:hypothetical protein
MRCIVIPFASILIPAASVLMNDEPISWRVAASVYWTILWRSIAMILLLIAPFDLLLTWLLVHGRIDQGSALSWGKQFLGITLLCVFFIAVRMALRKRYRGFRIAIICEQS